MSSAKIARLTLLVGLILLSCGVVSNAQTGTTKIEEGKQQARALKEAVEWLMEKAVGWGIQRELDQLQPEIKRQMPKNGGVLVIAWVAEEKEDVVGAGQVKRKELMSISLGAAGPSEVEAWKKYQSQLSDSIIQSLFSPDPTFFDFKLRKIWLPSSAQAPARDAGSSELRRARDQVARLLQAVRVEYVKEKERLEIERQGIESHRKLMEDQRRRLDQDEGQRANDGSPGNAVTSAIRQEEGKLRTWRLAEEQAIAKERNAIEAESIVIAALRQRSAKMTEDFNTKEKVKQYENQRSWWLGGIHYAILPDGRVDSSRPVLNNFEGWFTYMAGTEAKYRTAAERYLGHYKATGDLIEATFPGVDPEVWRYQVRSNNTLNREVREMRKPLDEVGSEIANRTRGLEKRQEALRYRSARFPKLLQERQERMRATAEALKNHAEVRTSEKQAFQDTKELLRDRADHFHADFARLKELNALIEEASRMLSNQAVFPK